ncbi:aminotransferase class V-fold PLP-dependent enzyme [Winslowiella iniecta]|uniref:aminotransferase class V-fold PLP-dependent enzyme n=1 Tax=Winslowiella iniecta TaxID=1560201 RepID=UPI00069DEC72|nr:aminotransferase class V-fold PLP-dependent enzyme [Winslowiella iniecta]
MRKALLQIAGCNRHWSAIPLQGSDSFAVEAMLCSLLTATDHLLIVENGSYGYRMAEICHIYHIRHSVLHFDPRRGIELNQVALALEQDRSITHIAAAHFEKLHGVKNDIDGLAQLAGVHGCRLMVDAVYTFGALPLNYTAPSLAAVALSSNKCLHAPPGIAFVLVCKSELAQRTPPRTYSLDLKAQHRALEQQGQWRISPCLSMMEGLHQAIERYLQQGGREARYQLYCQRMIHLLKGMAALGFRPCIEPQYCAPLLVTLAARGGQQFDIGQLNECIRQRQLALRVTPGEEPRSFRISVMGEFSLTDIDSLVAAFRDLARVQRVHPQ